MLKKKAENVALEEELKFTLNELDIALSTVNVRNYKSVK
jgi:hypothetical protein